MKTKMFTAKKLLSFSVLITFWLSNTVFAQQATNLLVNPSFENKIYCPTGYSQFEQNAIGWTNLTHTTPDLFNSCNNSINGIVGVPVNNNGTMSAHSGDGYAGIITYWNDDKNKPPNQRWREYIQTSIQLQRGIEYDIEFYASLASKSGWATKIHALVTDNPISRTDILPIITSPTFESSNIITTIGQRTHNTFKFTAQSTGTYYLTIGLFSDNDFHQTTNNPQDNGFAYYYIDDVSVTAQGCCPDNLTIENHTYSSPQVIAANNTITVGTNVTIQPGANITFVGGNQVVFLPGFEGTDFTATIGACPADFQHKSIDQFPSVITPNGDGINDEICLNAYGGSNYSVQIYNRWGNLVYAGSGAITTMPLCVWDGSCNQPFPACDGNSLSDGVYYGILNIIGCDFPNGSFTQNIAMFGGNHARMANPDSSSKTNNYSLIAYSDSSSLKEKTILQVQLFEDLNVFPNPSSGLITASFPSDKFPYTLQIFDAIGNLVFIIPKTNLSVVNINVSQLPKGLYHLRVINENQAFIKKFVLE